MSCFRCDTPDARLAFDTEAEADGAEARIRASKHNPNVVVWWQSDTGLAPVGGTT